MGKRSLCTAVPPLKEGGGAVVHRLEETRGGKIIKVKGTKSVLKKVRAVGYCGLFSCPCIHPGHRGHLVVVVTVVIVDVVVIYHFHIDHNAPCLSPPPPKKKKKMHDHCLRFLLGRP